MNEYIEKIILFRRSMSIVKEMYVRKIITQKEYLIAQKLLIHKYAVDPKTIYSDNA